MSATLNYDLKRAPTALFESGRWDVLTQLIVHSNGRNRCWPTVRTLAKITGKSISTVVDAKKWLIEKQAVRQIPYELRMDKEKKLPKRQCVYELTGRMIVDGSELQYLYINHEDNGDEDVSLGKTLDDSPSEISPSETKVLSNKESNTNTSIDSLSQAKEATDDHPHSKNETDTASKEGSPEAPPPTPSPESAETKLKNAMAILCYGTLDIFKDKKAVKSMINALVRIKTLTPGMTDKTVEAFGRDWNKNDFRGKKGQRPKPHQVADEWLGFKERCKTDPACNGQGSGLQSDYVRIPHPDPDKAKLGIFKTVHRSELEAKKT